MVPRPRVRLPLLGFPGLPAMMPGVDPEKPVICQAMCTCQNVRDLPGIKRGSDYHFHARQFMEAGQVKFNFTKDIYTKQVGGVDFDVMEMEMEVHGMVVRQKYYATIMKGYALCFVISYSTAGEEAPLQKILAGINFKPVAPAADK